MGFRVQGLGNLNLKPEPLIPVSPILEGPLCLHSLTALQHSAFWCSRRSGVAKHCMFLNVEGLV